MWISLTRGQRYVLGLMSVGVIVILWLFVTWKPLVSPLFLPGAEQIVEQLEKGMSLRQWAGDFAASNFRVLFGFVLAVVISIPIGVMIGMIPIVDALVSPFVEMMRYVPVPALLPLSILWFGIDESQKILIILFGTMFQLATAVAFAVRSVPVGFVETGLTLGLSRWRVLTSIAIPAASPAIYDSIRVSFGWAWSYLVVAEIVGNSGIGYRLMASQRYLQTGLVFIGIGELAVLGWFSDVVFRRMRRVLLPWAQ